MNPSITDHPDQIQLTAFLDGRLSDDDRLMVERHVEQCDNCCRAMSELPQDTLSGKLLDVDTDADDVSFVLNSETQPADAENGIPAALIDHPRYRILGPLGRGGMGMVYKAQHRMMDREVALKVIDAKFINNPQAIERFRNEVKAAACLTHANIVRAYDAEQAGDLHFLVMEFVDGISLAELIRRNGPLPVHQVCGIVRKVAQGLHHAFEQGMVHRDIKPQNIMITLDGRVRILDFGLARLAREQEEPANGGDKDPSDQMRRTADALTLVGSVLGTPDYIAPEQVMDAHAADTRADIYSLGCTCYFLLTGHPPYPDGTAVQKLMAHSEMSPSPIANKRPDVPDEVIEITGRMMERIPADRFQTPRDIAKAVDGFLKTGPSSAANTETAVQAGQTTFAISDNKQPAYSEAELLKVDLSAISVEDSELLSSVAEPAAAAAPNSLSEPAMETQDLSSQWQPTQELPPVSQSQKTAPSRRNTSRRAINRQSRSTKTGIFLTVAAVLVVTGLILFPPGNNETPSDTSAFSKTAEPRDATSPDTATTLPSDAGRSDDWVKLLPMVNPGTAMAGRWRMNDGALSVDREHWARIGLPVDVPDEYDLEVTFTRNSGENSIALIFARNDHQATLDIDAWAQNLAGFQNIDGENCEVNATRVTGYKLINKQRYTARLAVRRDRVEAFLDGQLITTYKGNGSNLSLIPQWRLPKRTSIGLGAYYSATTFHSVRFRPVNAKR